MENFIITATLSCNASRSLNTLSRSNYTISGSNCNISESNYNRFESDHNISNQSATNHNISNRINEILTRMLDRILSDGHIDEHQYELYKTWKELGLRNINKHHGDYLIEELDNCLTVFETNYHGNKKTGIIGLKTKENIPAELQHLFNDLLFVLSTYYCGVSNDVTEDSLSDIYSGFEKYIKIRNSWKKYIYNTSKDYLCNIKNDIGEIEFCDIQFMFIVRFLYEYISAWTKIIKICLQPPV